MPLVTLGLMLLVLTAMSSPARHLIGFTVYAALVAILIVQLLQLRKSVMWRWLDFRAGSAS